MAWTARDWTGRAIAAERAAAPTARVMGVRSIVAACVVVVDEKRVRVRAVAVDVGEWWQQLRKEV